VFEQRSESEIYVGELDNSKYTAFKMCAKELNNFKWIGDFNRSKMAVRMRLHKEMGVGEVDNSNYTNDLDRSKVVIEMIQPFHLIY
jgi:hypothetical protein